MGFDQPSGNPEWILIWESVTTLVSAIAMLAIGFDAPAYHHEKRPAYPPRHDRLVQSPAYFPVSPGPASIAKLLFQICSKLWFKQVSILFRESNVAI
jgi:hypothetical protein